MYASFSKIKFLNHRIKVPPMFPRIIQFLYAEMTTILYLFLYPCPLKCDLQLFQSRDLFTHSFTRLALWLALAKRMQKDGVPVPRLGLKRSCSFHFLSWNSAPAMWASLLKDERPVSAQGITEQPTASWPANWESLASRSRTAYSTQSGP